MNKKPMVLLVFVLLTLAFLVACASPPPDEAVKTAEENFRQAVIKENTSSLVYDNGENFLVVNSKEWSTAMVVLQKWVDEHPEKMIVAIATNTGYEEIGAPSTGWLVYYEDRHQDCK